MCEGDNSSSTYRSPSIIATHNQIPKHPTSNGLSRDCVSDSIVFSIFRHVLGGNFFDINSELFVVRRTTVQKTSPHDRKSTQNPFLRCLNDEILHVFLVDVRGFEEFVVKKNEGEGNVARLGEASGGDDGKMRRDRVGKGFDGGEDGGNTRRTDVRLIDRGKERAFFDNGLGADAENDG